MLLPQAPGTASQSAVRRSPGHAGPLLLVAAAVLWVGCRGAEPGTLLRLIEDEPQEVLAPAALGTSRTVLDVDFENREGLDGWRPVDGTGTWGQTREGLEINASSRAVEIERVGPLVARDLHSLEVVLASLRMVQVRLRWEGDARGEQQGGQIALNDSDGTGPRERRRFVLDLYRHPSWSGRIARLVLEIVLPLEERIRVRRIRGLHYTVPPAELRQNAARAWNVEAGEEMRAAFVVAPEIGITREVAVPASGVLRFGLGASGRGAVGMRFRVTAARPQEAPSVLFETSLARADVGRWRDHEIELGDWSGGRIFLKAEASAKEDFEPVRGLPLWAHPEVVGQRPPAMPNVVLISIDTLRADHLSLYGYERSTSPEIDAWAKARAAVFTQAIAPAPWTLPSHTSMLTGVGPLRHGTNFPGSTAPSDLTTLAERLRQAGFFTVGVTGGGFLHPGYGLAQGFDRYRYWRWAGEGRGRVEWESHVDAVLHALPGLRRPFFLFVHTFDVHDYSHFPVARKPAGLDPDVERILHYDAALSHMDALLGRLLRRLGAPDMGETVVVLTSDHGEGLVVEEELGHGSLKEHTLRVPLVVALPHGRGAGKVVGSLVRSVDLVPTLLDLVGLAVPSSLDGRSLLPLLDGGDPRQPALALSYAAVGPGLALRDSNRVKYLWNNSARPSAHGEEALYRLAADPQERHNLAPQDPQTETFRALARRLVRDRLRGLQLRLTNASQEPFSGRIRGTLVKADATKALRLPCPCIEELADGMASFSLAPGQEVELLFERAVQSDLSLEARLGTAEETAWAVLHVDLAEAKLPAAFRFGAAGWQRQALDPKARTTGVELRHQGWQAPSGPAPFAGDADLRRQLEALGYLGGS